MIDLESGEHRNVTPFDDVQAQVIGSSRRHPGEIVLGLNRDNPQLHDAYLLHLADGRLELLATNPGYTPWLIDEDLQPRGGTRFLEDGSAEVIVDGEVLLAIPPDDALSTGVIGFTGDGAGLYAVSSIDRNAAALVRFDLKSGEVETLASDPTYDVHAVELHPLTRELADRELRTRPGGARRGRSHAGRRRRRDARRASGRPRVRRTRSRRSTLDHRLQRRRRPGHLQPVRPGHGRKPVSVSSPAAACRVQPGEDGAVLVSLPRRPRDPRLPDISRQTDGGSSRPC